MKLIKFLLSLAVICGLFGAFNVAGQVANARLTFALGIAVAIVVVSCFAAEVVLVALWRKR